MQPGGEVGTAVDDGEDDGEGSEGVRERDSVWNTRSSTAWRMGGAEKGVGLANASRVLVGTQSRQSRVSRCVADVGVHQRVALLALFRSTAPDTPP